MTRIFVLILALGCGPTITTGTGPEEVVEEHNPEPETEPETEPEFPEDPVLRTCGDPPPPNAPIPPRPAAYSGGACPTLISGENTAFSSSGLNRSFILVVPDNYDPEQTYPILFGWHWLNSSANSFLHKAGIQEVADYYDIIVILPNASGDFLFDWPVTPFDIHLSDVDLTFFDDMLSCASEQFNVDPYCVGSMGVSAGGLWTSYLGVQRGEYLSSNLSLSGGRPDDYGGPFWEWEPPDHRYAALVLWGGPTDWLGLSFSAASERYELDLLNSGHFVVECVHDSGHSEPPLELLPDRPKYAAIIGFLLDHPYWIEGTSRYETEGLPDAMPDWCSIP